MNKNYYFSLSLLMVLMTVLALVACHDDDDEVKADQSYTSCPDNNHPHLIDLGLPSGTKWACCNMGASSPEKYGVYYAWGEKGVKNKYSWDNYIYRVPDGTYPESFDIGSDIAGTQYDVAHAKWKGDWRMPTKAQCDELRDNCSYRWTKMNDVNGFKFISKTNGGTIFLPATGYRLGDKIFNEDTNGHYWTSTLYKSNTSEAYSFLIWPDHPITSEAVRYGGHCIRPVLKRVTQGN